MIQYPDLKPMASSNARTVKVKSFPIYRSDTVATLTFGTVIPITTMPNTEWNYTRATLPASATPLSLGMWSQAASNAGTTATVNIGTVMPYISISAAGTTATVTFALPHQLTTADFIFVKGSGQANFDTSAATAVASVPTATTITYTISSTTATATQGELVCLSYYLYAYDVKTVASGKGQVVPNAVTRFGFMPNAAGTYQTGQFHVGFPNINPITTDTDWGQPFQGGDQQIVVTYAETGTASSTGGPWVVYFEYA
jgi:hypothetical protein